MMIPSLPHARQFLSMCASIRLRTSVIIMIKERHDHRTVSVNHSNSGTNAIAKDIL